MIGSSRIVGMGGTVDGRRRGHDRNADDARGDGVPIPVRARSSSMRTGTSMSTRSVASARHRPRRQRSAPRAPTVPSRPTRAASASISASGGVASSGAGVSYGLPPAASGTAPTTLMTDGSQLAARPHQRWLDGQLGFGPSLAIADDRDHVGRHGAISSALRRQLTTAATGGARPASPALARSVGDDCRAATLCDSSAWATAPSVRASTVFVAADDAANRPGRSAPFAWRFGQMTWNEPEPRSVSGLNARSSSPPLLPSSGCDRRRSASLSSRRKSSDLRERRRRRSARADAREADLLADGRSCGSAPVSGTAADPKRRAGRLHWHDGRRSPVSSAFRSPSRSAASGWYSDSHRPTVARLRSQTSRCWRSRRSGIRRRRQR